MVDPDDIGPGHLILCTSLCDRLDSGLACGRRRWRRIGAAFVWKKCEGHAKNVDVFWPEQSGHFVNLIRCPSQSATHNLLAQKLGRECPQTHDVRDSLGIPAF